MPFRNVSFALLAKALGAAQERSKARKAAEHIIQAANNVGELAPSLSRKTSHEKLDASELAKKRWRVHAGAIVAATSRMNSGTSKGEKGASSSAPANTQANTTASAPKYAPSNAPWVDDVSKAAKNECVEGLGATSTPLDRISRYRHCPLV